MKTVFNKGGIASYAVFLLLSLFVVSCATYFEKNQELVQAVYTYDFTKANLLLKDDAQWEKPERNKLLFYLNKGTILWMQGDYANSKNYFAKADLFVEDYNKKAGDAVMTMLVNAKMSTYPGENFEQILLHYYGALNYIGLGQLDEALIEGKRMQEKMQKITDRYENKNKYKRDAFAHNLLGIIYDMKGEYNDAFIAYKNAYEVYSEDYASILHTSVPEQLKRDLLRTAKMVGFSDEVRKYEALFDMKAESVSDDKAQLVFFWNNGLGPIKDELSITIMIIPYSNGWVQFVNPELGISIPFRTDDDNQRKDLLDMKVIRMALPKYVTRLPYYTSAQIQLQDSSVYGFSMAEDINAIAYRSLEDRMGRELAVSLSRVALKQLAAHKAAQNKDQQGLAAVAMLYGAISEQADTRNWQFLPYQINYTRVTMPTGNQTIWFKTYRNSISGVSKCYDLNLKAGETKVIATHTLEFAGYQGR